MRVAFFKGFIAAPTLGRLGRVMRSVARGATLQNNLHRVVTVIFSPGLAEIRSLIRVPLSDISVVM